jgi:transposase InsO family protein
LVIGLTELANSPQNELGAIYGHHVLTAKSECLNKMILFGEQHLRRTLNELVAHYNQDRPHQSLGNNPIQPWPGEPPTEGEIVVDERLGGLLRSYRRSA